MQKAIQITGIVKEDNVNVEYETGKHDSISAAEEELQQMIAHTEYSETVASVKLIKMVHNIVEDYTDEMDLLKRYPDAINQLEVLKKDYLSQ